MTFDIWLQFFKPGGVPTQSHHGYGYRGRGRGRGTGVMFNLLCHLYMLGFRMSYINRNWESIG